MKLFLYILGILWIIYSLQIPRTAATKGQSENIIVGSRAQQYQFPWHVLLKKHEDHILLCGGSIVNNKWVLTAAHCLIATQSVLLIFGTLDVLRGDVNMTSTIFCIYPAYNPAAFSDDIALIQLPMPLNYTASIQPVPLVTIDEAARNNLFIGVQGLVSGFGRTSDTSSAFSRWLLWGREEVVTNAYCYPTFGPLTNREMCTIGYNNNRQHPCSGDSGGALVWKNEANVYKQIGIIAFARIPPCSQYPTGYTRVSTFLNYIYNIIQR